MQQQRIRHWPEAAVLATGTLPLVTIWLHAYSHTPSWHPEPTWSHTLALVTTTATGTVALAWLLRRRLVAHWALLALIALAGPPAVAASGVIRMRATGSEVIAGPIVASLAASAACLVAVLVLALVPLPRRLAPLLLPVALALLAGHAAYELPWETQYSIARGAGYPYPTPDAMGLIYGHQIES